MPSPALKKLGRDLTRPLGKMLAATGVTANAVTITGLLFAAACGLLLARGEGVLAFLCLAASSLCDMLDGAVARAGGEAGTPIGAALDSTADRYGEALILTGVLINGHRHGRNARIADNDGAVHAGTADDGELPGLRDPRTRPPGPALRIP